MRRTTRTALVAMLMTVGVAAPVAATHGQPDLGTPIHWTLIGEHAIDETAPDCDDGAIWRFDSFGSDQVSHLGRVDYSLTHCTFIIPGEPPVFVFADGTFTFEAANGDTLVVLEEGTSLAVEGGAGFTADGTFTVVDGTGRFVGATGSGTLTAIGDIPGDGITVFGLPDGAVVWTLDGTLTYDASNRSR